MGPIGAALGVFIGHQFDTGAGHYGLAAGRRPIRLLVNQLFFPTTFRVMGHVAKADGRVSEQEIASARADHARAAPERGADAGGDRLFHRGQAARLRSGRGAAALRGAIAPYPELAHFFMEIQLQAALAGNGLSELPRARLRRVAALLGLGAGGFRAAREPAALSQPERPARAAATAPRHRGGPRGQPQASAEERLAQAYSLLEASADDGG